MKKFNLDRLNAEMLKLGESPIKLKRTTYRSPIINKNKMLKAKDGSEIGTKGDMYHKVILDRILQYGTLDHNPRPHYEDFYEDATYDKETNTVITKDKKKITLSINQQVFEKEKSGKKGIEVWTPAHTLSVNDGIECTYDLSKGESPMITLRPIATKASTAEILWIYQVESNDLVVFDEMLGKRTWDDTKPPEENKVNNWWMDWAVKDKDGNYVLNENGHYTIENCYGGTTAPRHMIYKEVIEPLKKIKENKSGDSRRLITCLWQIDDFEKPHGLKPCAFLTIWNVRHDWDGKDYLDMTMVQRSSDFCTAGCINQVQYAALQLMVAKATGFEPGRFTWKPVNVQIYDRHIDQAIELMNREPVKCKATMKVDEKVDNFEDFDKDSIEFVDCPKQLIKEKNPQLKFPLGI